MAFKIVSCFGQFEWSMEPSTQMLVLQKIAKRAGELKAYIAELHRQKPISDYGQLMASIDQVPGLLVEFFQTPAFLNLRRSLSDEAKRFIPGVFYLHQFGLVGRPIEEIRHNLSSFVREVTHLIRVNQLGSAFDAVMGVADGDMASYVRALREKSKADCNGIELLAHLSGEAGAEKAFRCIRDVALRWAETRVLLHYFLSLHDFGKFHPPYAQRDGMYLNDYACHGMVGDQRLAAFIEQNGEIVRKKLLPVILRKRFKAYEIDAMLVAIQLAHTNMAAMPTGETHLSALIAVLKRMTGQASGGRFDYLSFGFRSLLADPVKLGIFTDTLALLLMADVASYRRLVCQDVDFYIRLCQQFREMLIRLGQDQGLARRVQWFQLMGSDAGALIRDLCPSSGVSDFWAERFERFLTVNTLPDSVDRQPGRVMAQFRAFLAASFDPAEAKDILGQLEWYFNHVQYSRYSRHFFQVLCLDKSGGKAFYEAVKGFDRQGVLFLKAFIEQIRARFDGLVQKGILHPSGMVDVQTGSINGLYSEQSMQFIKEIVQSPEKWGASFERITSKTPEDASAGETVMFSYPCFSPVIV